MKESPIHTEDSAESRTEGSLHGVVSAKQLAAMWAIMIASNALNLVRGVTDLRIHSLLCEVASCVCFWVLYAIVRQFWR